MEIEWALVLMMVGGGLMILFIVLYLIRIERRLYDLENR